MLKNKLMKYLYEINKVQGMIDRSHKNIDIVRKQIVKANEEVSQTKRILIS